MPMPQGSLLFVDFDHSRRGLSAQGKSQYEFQIYEDGRLVAHKAFTITLVQEG